MRKDIYIIGHGRHGKDTVGDMLEELGFKTCASSWFMAEKVVFPALKDKYGYDSVHDCFNDRHAHRAEWFDLIGEANPTGVELSAGIFKEHDVYIGIRSRRELDAVKSDPSFNPFVVWVDASDRLPPEDIGSMELTVEDADYFLNNNGSIEKLKSDVYTLAMTLWFDLICICERKIKEAVRNDIK
jgi:hypothetical protein